MRGTTTKPAIAPADLDLDALEAATAPDQPVTEPGAPALTLDPQDFAIPAMPFDCSAGGGQFLPERPTGEEVPLSSGMGGTYELVDGKRVRV